MRPLERLVSTRTGSSGSSVRPAPTSTRVPARLARRTAACSTAAPISSTSASRPGPMSPEASSPLAGPTMTAPRRRSTRTFSCVAAWRHMPKSIDGATTRRARLASTMVVSASGASPCTSRAIKSAVAGASTITSAASARSMCPTLPLVRLRASSGSTRSCFCSSQSEVMTGLPESASKVSGVTKRSAAGVITTTTAALRRLSQRTSSQVL